MPIGFMSIGRMALVAAFFMAITAMISALMMERMRIALAMSKVFMERFLLGTLRRFGPTFFMEGAGLMEVVRFMEGTEFFLLGFSVGIRIGQNRGFFGERFS